MRKSLLFLIISAICLTVAFHYFRPDFSWITNAEDDEHGAVTDIDQPLPHAVLPSLSNDWADFSAYIRTGCAHRLLDHVVLRLR